MNSQQPTNGDQVIFVDSAVEDYQILIDNLTQSSEIVILDPQRDGVLQITESLSKYDDLDAIHIVSHGDSGQLFLGNSLLDSASLSEYEDDLNYW